jgi:hypothetical protein
LRSTFACAAFSTALELSMESTDRAPPASAESVNPPV